MILQAERSRERGCTNLDAWLARECDECPHFEECYPKRHPLTTPEEERKDKR